MLVLLTALASGEPAPVELELVLAVDTSVSVDAREYRLQTEGLAAAFRDPSIVAAIRHVGPIAVSVVQWGVGLQQRVVVDWTRIRDAAEAASFARAIEACPRHFSGNGTGITQALHYASELFNDNEYNGRRRIIDISGDGRNNSGANPSATRDRIVASGIVINGLAVLDGDVSLAHYFEQNVTGGPESFVQIALTFEDFAVAIRKKLLREVLNPTVSASVR